jgi:thioredoxin 1
VSITASSPIAQERSAEVSPGAAVEDKAKKQVLFREVNERIAELSREWGETDVSLFVCECSNPECAEALEIRPDEYERVRAHADRFVVAAGHHQAEVERVVEDSDRFVVVENHGAAAEIARASDPRRTNGEHAATGDVGAKPKLVFFYSPQSGRCRRVEGFLAQVLQRRANHDTFQLVRVSVEDRPDLAERFRIETVPTLCVVEDRRLRKRIVAPRGGRELERELAAWLH